MLRNVRSKSIKNDFLIGRAFTSYIVEEGTQRLNCCFTLGADKRNDCLKTKSIFHFDWSLVFYIYYSRDLWFEFLIQFKWLFASVLGREEGLRNRWRAVASRDLHTIECPRLSMSSVPGVPYFVESHFIETQFIECIFHRIPWVFCITAYDKFSL